MSRLQARNLSLNLAGREVLHQVNLDARPGQVHGLLGPNGAGKTSLLRILAGLQQADAGEVTLDGQPLQALSPRQRARCLSYLPQGTECHWPLAAREVVALGRLPFRAPWRSLPAEDAELISAAMGETDVTHLASRPINSLSGGERARVLLARSLATGSGILLADEPVAGLDPAHQLQVMNLLRARANAGANIIVVLHDLNLAARFCDQLTLIANGNIVAQGNPDAVLAAKPLQQAYGIRTWNGTIEGQKLVVPMETTPSPGI